MFGRALKLGKPYDRAALRQLKSLRSDRKRQVGTMRGKRWRAIRKRIRNVLEVPFVIKQYAWRLTASWFWIWIVGALFGFRTQLNLWEKGFFLDLYGTLANFGFAPSNPKTFAVCIKLLWLFAICSFSWVQVLGFLIYVPFLPILFLVGTLLRKRTEPYRKTRRESLKQSRKSGTPFVKRNWGFPLLCFLLLWFVLYGQTCAEYPLFLALFLTMLLFCSRVGSALRFAVPADTRTWVRIEFLSASARKFVSKSSESLKSGQILDQWSLRLQIWTGQFILQIFRWWSTWLHGSVARRRIALVVLFNFMLNLGALGGISILFWAFAIKFMMSPAQISFSEALLASASRVVPGIPDPSTLKIPAVVQILDSLTAWLLFVLYAGPVASLFPSFQEQAIARAAVNYSRLRVERKAMYRFLEPLLSLQTLAREQPELMKVAKAAVALRTHSEAETREALLSQPDTLRALVAAPTVTGFMRQLGAPIPDLIELVQELPPPVLGEQSPHEAEPHIGLDVPQRDEGFSPEDLAETNEEESAECRNQIAIPERTALEVLNLSKDSPDRSPPSEGQKSLRENDPSG